MRASRALERGFVPGIYLTPDGDRLSPTSPLPHFPLVEVGLRNSSIAEYQAVLQIDPSGRTGAESRRSIGEMQAEIGNMNRLLREQAQRLG